MSLTCSSSTQRVQSNRHGPRQLSELQHCVPRPVSCQHVAQHRPARQPLQLVAAHTHHHTASSSGSRSTVRARAAAEARGAVAQGDVLVEEVMNPHPVLLQEGMSIKDAVHTMLEANIAGAPVVDASGQITGVLTEADVIWKGTGKPEEFFIVPPVYIGALDSYFFLRDSKAFEEETHKVLARTVKDAMVGKDKVVTIKSGALMSEAAQLMVHHDINLLPVVDDDGSSVVGIVTRHDILRGMYSSQNPLL